MFEWLFPGWTAPGLLTALIVARTLCNLGLTAAIREASASTLAITAGAALTVASTALTVGVLRGTFGITVSHAESLLQLSLLVLAGAVVLRGDGDGRGWAILAGAGAVLLYLFSIPLFGEATVAP